MRRLGLLDAGEPLLIVTVNRTAQVAPAPESCMSDEIPLSQARRGDRGVIVKVGAHGHHLEHEVELERRLLELGFVEGAHVELLHEGLFGRDPIAMKVDDMRVALRRREAASLIVRLETR